MFTCATDRYFKITAEALRVLAAVAKTIATADGFDASSFIPELYKVTLDRLSAQDQDAEVKQCAISGMADIIAVLGDKLTGELGACRACPSTDCSHRTSQLPLNVRGLCLPRRCVPADHGGPAEK